MGETKRRKIDVQISRILPVMQKLCKDGYRCILIAGKRPDIIAIRGENLLVEGVEVVSKSYKVKPSKWLRDDSFDKIRWFISNGKTVMETEHLQTRKL
jgi:hypothetical protein